MKSSLLCLLLFGSTIGTTFAQSLLKGIVIDSLTQKPIPYATVTLKEIANASARTTLSTNEGYFKFEKLNSGKHVLSFAASGYKLKSSMIDLTAEQNSLTIVMVPGSIKLTEVSITGRKPIVTVEADRIIYDLQADHEAKGKTLLEMVSKVPMLSLGADENIQLKGSDNFKILINGKPSALVERNSKEFFRSVPASTIQQIEVITSPTAKYDSEGLTGIINIVTARQVAAGYNGTLNLRETVPTNSPTLGGSFTGLIGKLGISANAGINVFQGPKLSQRIHRENYGESNDETFDLQGTRLSRNDGKYAMGTLSYEIDSLNLISGQLNYYPGSNEFDLEAATKLTGKGSIRESYDWLANSRSKHSRTDASLNYQLGFRKNKNRHLTFSYRYMRNIDIEVLGFSAYNQVNYTDPDFEQQNTGSITEQTIQTDYIHPLKSLSIEAGLKGIFRKNQSDFSVHNYQQVSREFEIDPARTNAFDNDQNVLAIYNSYRLVRGSWDFRAGFRIESTHVNAIYNSYSTSYSQDYFNIVPSIALAKKMKNQSAISLSFGQRLQRPGIRSLNPFVDRTVKGLEQSGNPELKPILSNNIQAGYSKPGKTSMYLGLGYSFVNNMIMPVSIFYKPENVTRTTFENIGRERRLVGNVNFSYPINTKWTMNANGNLIYLNSQGMIMSELVSTNGFLGQIFFGTGYSTKKGLRLNGSVNLNSRRLGLQDVSNPTISSSISANKDLLKDKLSFSASISNPFVSYQTRVNKLSGVNFSQNSESRMYFRSMSASLNYRFGKLKAPLNKNKRGIANDDVL